MLRARNRSENASKMHAMSDGFVVQELGVSREGINIETLVADFGP